MRRKTQENSERENDRERDDIDLAPLNFGMAVTHAAYYYGLGATAIT